MHSIENKPQIYDHLEKIWEMVISFTPLRKVGRSQFLFHQIDDFQLWGDSEGMTFTWCFDVWSNLVGGVNLFQALFFNIFVETQLCQNSQKFFKTQPNFLPKLEDFFSKLKFPATKQAERTFYKKVKHSFSHCASIFTFTRENRALQNVKTLAQNVKTQVQNFKTQIFKH